ncbi:MAG: TetR/AcrR family transcriptional regulator [Archangium sp.]|nr:TetR/AcrR family transcriptional regulator [Archangium sp.]
MSKGDETRERILDRAFLIAGRDGLEGLTIGALADELKLSKSGLFSHFGSKEELQVAVLDVASSRFTERVLLPAFKAPRGLPRLQRIFEQWIDWMTDPRMPGGCIFQQANAELDDRQGRPHDVLLESQKNLVEALIKTVQLAVAEGHLAKDTDARQVAYEFEGIMMVMNLYLRLLKDRKAVERARIAFERLVDSHRA